MNNETLQTPPHETQTSPQQATDDIDTTQRDPTASVLAGVAKVFATKSALTVTFWLKGLIKWWFRYPIKLFRPHTISPYYVFSAMAQNEGKTVSLRYMKGVVADEGVIHISLVFFFILLIHTRPQKGMYSTFKKECFPTSHHIHYSNNHCELTFSCSFSFSCYSDDIYSQEHGPVDDCKQSCWRCSVSLLRTVPR
jgi:hypothetical protein